MRLATMTVLALCTMLGSCVTAIRGTSHECRITSAPSGASFRFGGQYGTTPATITVSRSWKPREFSCSLDGYVKVHERIEAQDLMISDAPLTAFFGFCGALLIVPGIVDLCTGSLYDYPHEIRVELMKVDSGQVSYVRLPR